MFAAAVGRNRKQLPRASVFFENASVRVFVVLNYAIFHPIEAVLVGLHLG
jgi:hypothetical protein